MPYALRDALFFVLHVEAPGPNKSLNSQLIHQTDARINRAPKERPRNVTFQTSVKSLEQEQGAKTHSSSN